MAHTADEFLSIIKPLVLRDAAESGILASLTAAQALIESNKGNSGLAVKGNNLFGMKGDYKGESVIMPTKEWSVARGYYTINAKFRKYPSWQESISDHSALFNRSKRYANLRGEKDYKTACMKVHQDGYATAYNYASTLINTIESYGLYTWDIPEEDGQAQTEVKESTPINRNPYKEPTKNVKKGCRGNDVRWLQYALNKIGNYHLIIDGIAGALTINALIDFQSKHGLDPDGICGKLTRAKLIELTEGS